MSHFLPYFFLVLILGLLTMQCYRSVRKQEYFMLDYSLHTFTQEGWFVLVSCKVTSFPVSVKIIVFGTISKKFVFFKQRNCQHHPWKQVSNWRIQTYTVGLLIQVTNYLGESWILEILLKLNYNVTVIMLSLII